MSTANKKELQIIEAFSSVSIPEDIIRSSNISGLMDDMLSDQDNVTSSAKKLERARQAKKDGNAIGNWWNNRNDDVQDAQIDLSKSIGSLTQKSSQLLIVNTAISKVLSDQQGILYQQQKQLEQQTKNLEAQNTKIFEQQKQLEEQNNEIQKANQGLMEAKGVTQEQAKELVGCVKLVTQAEKRIADSNQALTSGIEQQLHTTTEQYLGKLDAGFAQQAQHYKAFEQQLLDVFAKQSQQAQQELKDFATAVHKFKQATAEQQQAHNQAMLEKTKSQDTVIEQLGASLLERNKNQDTAIEQLGVSLTAQHTQHVQDIATKMDATASALEQAMQTMRHTTESALHKQTETQAVQHEALVSEQKALTIDLESKAAVIAELTTRLENLQSEQQKNKGRTRLALTAVTALALAGVGWHIAQNFTLIQSFISAY